MIERIVFHRYKALNAATHASNAGMNILTGANNAGKSTVLSALRILAAGLQRAKARAPARWDSSYGKIVGWAVKGDGLPVSLENVHSDLVDADSTVTFETTEGWTFVLVFPASGGCFLTAEGGRQRWDQPLRNAPVISPSPVLGPVEHDEPLVSKETVQRGLGTHRAARHFRNYWYHFPDGFETFAALVERSWPGTRIERPEISSSVEAVQLHQFCQEDRRTRELYWAGFGFQIWCQICTHLSRASNADIFVVDEPETYLHPRLQRRLVDLLRESGKQVFLATHSASIVSASRPGEVSIVERPSRIRRLEICGLEAAIALELLPKA